MDWLVVGGPESADFADRQRDSSEVGWPVLVPGAGWSGPPGGPVAQLRGGSGGHGQGGAYQCGVPTEGFPGPDLGLVESEVVLGKLETFLYGLTESGGADQCAQRGGPFGRDVAVVEGEFAGPAVFADQERVARSGGVEPVPGVGPFALRSLPC